MSTLNDQLVCVLIGGKFPRRMNKGLTCNGVTLPVHVDQPPLQHLVNVVHLLLHKWLFDIKQCLQDLIVEIDDQVQISSLHLQNKDRTLQRLAGSCWVEGQRE